ncbi:hypothetical protein AN189_18465, partial [Loktanella sp. 3ANDIMAR09]|uniref:YadA-like family protein n=1 Tax=Loktanella sp. 3ANDIMAR09 TaxID=1225657 RepID=UPI0007081CB8
FSGSVDIAGPTTVSNSFTVMTGTSTLDVNSDSVMITSGGEGGGTLTVTPTSVSLTQNGAGLTSSGGRTTITGTETIISGSESATLSGGGTSLVLNSSGLNISTPSGAPTIISGVADGVAPNDAVNVRQLGALEGKMSAGIAQSMAMSQLPGLTADETYSFGAAMGGFNSEYALALGGSARLDNNLTVRGAASYSDASGLGVAAGVGWSW